MLFQDVGVTLRIVTAKGNGHGGERFNVGVQIEQQQPPPVFRPAQLDVVDDPLERDAGLLAARTPGKNARLAGNATRRIARAGWR